MVNLHEYIKNTLLSYNVIIHETNHYAEYDSFYDRGNKSIDFLKNEIHIIVCLEELNWVKEGKQNFVSSCCIDVEDIVHGLNIKGKCVDAYCSIISNNTLLLNNYDAVFYEYEKNSKGFCNILGFSTIDANGLVKFSQIVYNFKYKKLIVRDYVEHKLPFKPDLENDFGGKRATYRHGNILSLRTNENVYLKTTPKYHQSEKHINDLSYPRLELHG